MARCLAKSKRSQEQCKNWAIKQKTMCRFHGGKSTGPRTHEGKEKSRQSHLKHGRYTKEAIQNHREVLEYIKDCKNLLRGFVN